VRALAWRAGNFEEVSMICEAVTKFGEPLERLETETPKPQGKEVLLKVTQCGVCHSDVHLHDGYFDMGNGVKAPVRAPLPMTLGHEIEGTVAALGPDAKGVRVGDHVVAYPWIGCGECATCARGDEQLCAKPQQLGIQRGGGFADHCLVPDAKYLIDTGDAKPGLSAPYMCSGLTAYAALKKVGAAGKGDPILIVGFGGLGMMALAFARQLYPEAPLYVADVSPEKRKAALDQGVTAFDVANAKDELKRLLEATGGGAFAVLDFVGSESSFAFDNGAVRRGGRIIVVGLFGGAMSLPLPAFPLRAIAVMGAYVGRLDEAREVMALVRANKVAPIPLQERPLSAANVSLEDLRAGRVVGRVLLRP
jgi:D-arabinose 1-dehydrogenase-like Zn-dependent alcohol dehydrogenase